MEISLRVRAAGATTIYITHDQAESFALADRVGVLEGGRLVQLGPPEEVDTSPASAFVARFTGLAGELAVTIRSRTADTVEIEPDGLPPARALHARSALPANHTGPALLMIRPTAVELCAPDVDEHHRLGTVADLASRDRGYEHAIDLPEHTRLTGVFDSLRVDRGQPVGLRLATAGCLVFPA